MMDSVTYTLFDPTGNRTLLVETPIPIEEQPAVAGKLMALEPETEQVGFVSTAGEGVVLRMAGGEFCGNATMSAAALCLKQKERREGTVTVSVSGAKEPVPVTISSCSENVWDGTVQMPSALSVEEKSLPQSGPFPVVRFPGITHVILENSTLIGDAERLAPEWCRALGADALGLMFLNREAGTLRPLVWVPVAGTRCWESSCASGTTAVGAFLFAKTGKALSLSLRQPGGTLGIAADADGRLLLSGRVRYLRRAVRQLGKTEDLR